MSSNIVRHIGLFVLLALLQVLLFNKIHIMGYATPILYIYFIIKLPIDLNRNWVLLLSALMGLTIDSFSYTLGLHTLACVLTGFARFYFLNLFTPRDLFESVAPSFFTFGKGLFMRYASMLSLFHLVVLYLTESLSLFDPMQLIYRIAGSFLLTIILIFAFETLNKNLIKK